MEKWKNIKGFKGYKISSLGNVFSEKSGKNLKPQISGNGYYNITLSVDGVRTTQTIHRLVASHFLNKDEFCVNHKDGDKLNNNVNNLEWVSNSENCLHAHQLGLRPLTRKTNSKNTSGKVGVVYDNGYWIARLHKNRKAVYLGRFKDKQDAIDCRIKAENNAEDILCQK